MVTINMVDFNEISTTFPNDEDFFSTFFSIIFEKLSDGFDIVGTQKCFSRCLLNIAVHS